MQRFFVTPEQVRGEELEISITGSDVNHIANVLRMKEGEELEVSDGNNHIYLCAIGLIEEQQITVNIKEEQDVESELPCRIYLFQGLPKSDKMDLIVQKCVELGVYEVIPVTTKRTVVKLDEKKAAKRTERWNSIAEGACKQAGRGIIPRVTKPISFKEALILAAALDVRLIPYELAEDMVSTRQILGNIRSGQTVGIFIGPEGGFEREEVEMAIEIGAKPITLGKRILRTETAGLAMLSILMFQLEN